MSPVVGVIGGGQLARMMIPAAVNLGIDLRVLAENEGESASLAVSNLGDYRNVSDVLRFARDVDVVTFDHEHVPQEVLAALVAAGIAVHPGPAALAVAQDKLHMRETLSGLGIAMPEWARVENAEQLGTFLEAHGGAAVLKTPRGGYDGNGVRVVRSAEAGDDWFASRGALLVEELVPFRRELAQQVARRPSGQIVAWPIVETVQANGVCAEVIAPAPSPAPNLVEVAAEMARTIAESLEVTGALAVELFETDDERILVNELAMRPHNSGHWTIDGATTSQFEQHLRAVLDLPLGDATARQPWSVMVNILGGPTTDSLADRYPRAFAEQPAVKVHTYGKAPRPGRKVGHVTAIGDDLDDVVYRARAAAAHFAD
jgi:5-(carboxyamino)imidazole ribonucleotide synthase